jgi:hypothetical protein
MGIRNDPTGNTRLLQVKWETLSVPWTRRDRCRLLGESRELLRLEQPIFSQRRLKKLKLLVGGCRDKHHTAAVQETENLVKVQRRKRRKNRNAKSNKSRDEASVRRPTQR